MKCYKVSLSDEESNTSFVKFVGTQADVRATKAEWVKVYDVKKSDIVVEEVDVPIGKADLITFLNTLINIS